MPSMNVFIPDLIEPIELNRVTQMVVPGEYYRAGDLLYIYENIFSGNRQHLRGTRCESVLGIEINDCNKTVILNNRLIDEDEKDKLAKYCGFDSFEGMMKAYIKRIGLPLKGQLVAWL